MRKGMHGHPLSCFLKGFCLYVYRDSKNNKSKINTMELSLKFKPETPEREENDPRIKYLSFFPDTRKCICEGTGRQKNGGRCLDCRGLSRVPLIKDTIIPWGPERIEKVLSDIERTGQRQDR